MQNRVDPDQMVSSKANWSGIHTFFAQIMNPL